jgi:uncharacterized protein (TIGR02147 family)
MKKAQKPDIFQYTDYRDFLKDCFKYNKKENSNFTYRYFSQKAGYASPSTLKEVIDGKRDIPEKKIQRFIGPFKLNKKESAYFEKLVLYNQAEDTIDKSRYFRELIRMQKPPESKAIQPGQFSFYREWFHSVVREMVGLKNSKSDPAWIAERISPGISAEKVRQSLELLLKLGFIKRDKNGKLVQSVPKLSVAGDTDVQSVKQYVRKMIELEWEAIEKFDPQDREVSGLTMSMSKACYQDVKARLREFKEETLDYVCKHIEPSEVVCRLNFGLFPMLKSMERENN